jgi:AcrR family transcriptional regulator
MNDTKERILSVALYYFLKKPYTEVTMSEILNASGLSKGGFYHHFASKEILYHKVIDKFIFGTFVLEYDHFTSNPYDLPFCEFIPAYIKSTLEHLLDLANSNLGNLKLEIKEVNLYMVMFDMMKHYKGFGSMVGKFHQSEIDMFKTFIDKAKTKGEIRKDIDSLSLANHLHTLIHGIGVLEMLNESIDKNIEKNIKDQFNNLYQLIKT